MALSGGTYQEYYAQGSATIGLWVLQNGAWRKVSTERVSVSQNYTGPGQGGAKQLGWNINPSLYVSGPVEAFGVTYDSTDDGTGGAVTSVPQVVWQVQSSSGDRSATPSGEKVKSTMRPQ